MRAKGIDIRLWAKELQAKANMAEVVLLHLRWIRSSVMHSYLFYRADPGFHSNSRCHRPTVQ